MPRPVLALLALLLLAPAASAQVVDPEPVVETVCATVRLDLPLCPREEPAAPPAAHAAEEGPATPEAPQEPIADAAAEVEEAAADIVDDPTTAPDRLADLAAVVLQAARDLLAAGQEAAHGAGATVGGLVEVVADHVARAGAATDAILAGAHDLYERVYDDVKARTGAILASVRERLATGPTALEPADARSRSPRELAYPLIRTVSKYASVDSPL